MRIAQIAPLWEAVPPAKYGGTESVVHLLSEELLRQGHEVTLFASGDSHTSARLISPVAQSLRSSGAQLCDHLELQLMECVMVHAEEFDVVHNHVGITALPFASILRPPMLTTLHGAFKPQAFREFIQRYAHLPYVSISDYQRTGCPDLNYIGTVYHGLNLKAFSPSLTSHDKSDLVFLGRFSSEKGPHHAIRMALETGHRLIMAGKVDRVDREFFREEIEPWIDGERIVFIGEVNHPQKVKLMSQAKATLCPITWPEPFGLVLIESLACGTPVLALRDGSIPEVLRDGVTGFIRDSVEELTQCIGRISEIDRRICRHHVEQHFTVSRMAEDYLRIYRLLVEQSDESRYDQHQYPAYAVTAGPHAGVR